MIRCLEGHVFDSSLRQCPECGWSVSQEKAGFAERMRKSVMANAPLKPVLAVAGPARKLVADSVALLAARDGAYDAQATTAGSARGAGDPALTFLGLIRSRTIWAIAAATIATALFIDVLPAETDNGFNFIYLLATMIVIVFVFIMKGFLRSKVPLVLLLCAAGMEIAFMQAPMLPAVKFGLYESCQFHTVTESQVFWYWAYLWKAVIPSAYWGCPDSAVPAWIGNFLSYFIGVGIPEDSIKLFPVAILLLLAWGVRKLPENVISSEHKAKILSWSKLDRASTIVMLAFAGGVGFVLMETLGQYLNKQIASSGVPIAALIKVIPNYLTSHFPISLGNGKSLTQDQWRDVGLYIAQNYGFMSGLMLAIPRTIDLLVGHGAYAGVAAYYLALALRQPLKSPLA